MKWWAAAASSNGNVAIRALRPPGSDDRLPEEHAKKRYQNDPKDKAPGVTTTGHVVVGGQPVGIAQCSETTRTPARELTSPNINKGIS